MSESTTETAGESLRDALMASAEASETSTAETKPVETAVKPDTAETVDETVIEAPDSETATAEDKTGQPEKEEKPAAGDEAPKHWAEADRTMFAKQPAEVKNYLLKRHAAMEADYTRKTQEFSAWRREYEPVAQLFQPHVDTLKAKGFTPATLIQSWFNVENALAQGRGLDVVADIIRGYNIDPQAVIRAIQGPQQQQGVAPSVPGQEAQLSPAVLAQLDQLKNQISTLNRDREQNLRQKQLELQNQAVNNINAFIEAKGPDGILLHPHFGDVETDMALIVEAARSAGMPIPSLDEAYQKAVWANTSTREKLLSDQLHAAEKKRQDEARAKAAAAKRASSSVQGSPGSGAPAQARSSSASVREALLEAMADT